MNKLILSSIIILINIFPAFLNAQVNNQNKIDLREKIINQHSKLEIANNFSKIEQKKIILEESKEKSVLLGAIMSIILPGSGEFYSKSYLKSAIFFGAEVGLWTVFAVYQGKGNSQTTEYQNYANQNWNINKYAAWLKNQGFQGSSGINPNEPDFEVLRAQVNVCEEQNFSHTLPHFGEQQYYEVIGKYQSFISGWSTAGSDITKNNYGNYVLQQVQDYMVTRQQANDYYNVSYTSLDVIVLNHILSAADAVWTVSMFNKNLKVNTSFNLKNIYNFTHGQYKVTPFANLRVTF